MLKDLHWQLSLKALKVKLSDTDKKILPLKWKDEEDEAQLEVELSSCHEYEDRKTSSCKWVKFCT